MSEKKKVTPKDPAVEAKPTGESESPESTRKTASAKIHSRKTAGFIKGV